MVVDIISQTTATIVEFIDADGTVLIDMPVAELAEYASIVDDRVDYGIVFVYLAGIETPPAGGGRGAVRMESRLGGVPVVEIPPGEEVGVRVL